MLGFEKSVFSREKKMEEKSYSYSKNESVSENWNICMYVFMHKRENNDRKYSCLCEQN